MSNLIKRLREQGKLFAICSGYSVDETIYGEAADLIEQQQKRIEELEAQLGKVNNKCVVYDLEPAQHESAIRDHLIKLGWTPPKGEKR